MSTAQVIGIDLAKSVFQIHVADAKGHCILRKSVRRAQFLDTLANLPASLIGLEACGSSHHWARELKKLGHTVKLIAPQFVKPFVKSNKNDVVDAEAIAEAVVRPTMRFVPVKTEEQQALLLIHREREGLTKERTALINRIRSTLSEFGIFIPVGPQRLHRWFREDYAASEQILPVIMQRHVKRLMERLQGLESAIATMDVEIDELSKKNDHCKRLLEVPGIGRLTASALVASVGNGAAFTSARQFSAWLGLVPRQHSSGGKQRLLGVSKRGDVYLRKLLIHGARAVVKHMNPKRMTTPWLRQLSERAHPNVVIVALANKLARIAWSMLRSEQRYCEAI